MVALWIWAGTHLAGQTALGIRLLGPLSAALGSVLLAGAGEALFDRRTGLIAAVLFNATLILAAGSVTMTPDTPLLFFWTAALWAMARLIVTRRSPWWLAVGLFAGLALDSKYTAALLGAGLAMWLIGTPDGRRWLRTPWPWAGGLVAFACFTPVLWWNAAHHWASFAKQGGRTGDWHPAEAAGHVLELIGGQAGLATPGVFLVCALGVVEAVRRSLISRQAALLAALTLPGMAVFLQHAIGDRVQANWPAVLFPAACLAAAAYAPRFWRPAAGLGFAVGAVVYLQAATAILPLPRRYDPTLMRLAGWPDLAAQVAAKAATEHATFIAADNYGVASMLAFELPGTAVVGAEPRWSEFSLPPAPIAGQTGILLRSQRRTGPPDAAFWSSIEPTGTVNRSRNGVVAETYIIYNVTARAGRAEVPTLLR